MSFGEGEDVVFESPSYFDTTGGLDSERIDAIMDKSFPRFAETMAQPQANNIYGEIDFKPFPHQVHMNAALDSSLRVIGTAHRRAGKTVLYVHKLFDKAMNYDASRFPDRLADAPPRYAYLAPTKKQAEDIAKGYVKGLAERIGAKWVASERIVILPNGAEIWIRGMRGEGFRGNYLDGAVIDEYAYAPPTYWSAVLEPMLLDYEGFAWFVGTPAGRNHFFNLIQKAKRPGSGWAVFNFPITSTSHLSKSAVERYRQGTEEHVYRQEMHCDFDAPVKGSYWGQQVQLARTSKRTGIFPPSPGACFVAMDLGVRDLACIWWGQTSPGRINWFDCWADSNKTIQYIASLLKERKERFDLDYSVIFLPHDIRVREQTNADENMIAKTRLDTLQESLKGVVPSNRFHIIENHKVADRITAARAVFQTSVFNTANPGVESGLNALSLYQRAWNDDLQQYSDRPLKDWTTDYADAFGYGAYMLNTHKEKMVEISESPRPEKPTQLQVGNEILQELNLIATKQISPEDSGSLLGYGDNDENGLPIDYPQ